MPACAVMPSASAPPVPHERLPGAIEVRGTRFYLNERPFWMQGFNHWGATTLARDPSGWDRVRRDLDALQSIGVAVIRTMAATEGPDTEPLRVAPSIQPRPGRPDPAGVQGILRLAEELRARGLHAIFVLNNFWPWSGGMAQYLAWAGQGAIPYPPPIAGGSWDGYEDYTAHFYRNETAKNLFLDYVRFLVPALRNHPSIVWELANEPRAMGDRAGYRSWIDRTARGIKSLAPGHLVTTGSEGETAAPMRAGLDVVEDHRSPAVDFVTCHLWAQNWGWVRPESLEEDLPRALELARTYVDRHIAHATVLGKPLVLEEFGFPRDRASFEPTAPTSLRDRYFDAIYEFVYHRIGSTPIAGIMPWAWSGEGRPPRPGDAWRRGDPITGDPPHEPQGWYGVYSNDSTVNRIRQWSERMTARLAAA